MFVAFSGTRQENNNNNNNNDNNIGTLLKKTHVLHVWFVFTKFVYLACRRAAGLEE